MATGDDKALIIKACEAGFQDRIANVLKVLADGLFQAQDENAKKESLERAKRGMTTGLDALAACRELANQVVAKSSPGRS